MIDVQTVKCPDCGRSFDFSNYVGEEPLDSNVRLTKKLVQRTSWEELETEICAGRAALCLDVGDNLEFELKNGKKVSVEVAAVNPYGDNVAFSFANVLQDAVMNSANTNRGGFCESKMADLLEKEILPLMPDDLIKVITPRKITQKLSVSSSSGRSERIFERECKLWLPSYTEVFGHHERYSGCDVGDIRFPLFSTRRGRTKYTLDDDLSLWWLRSPLVGHSTCFWLVYNAGNDNYAGASNANGVCPCFIIGKKPEVKVEE